MDTKIKVKQEVPSELTSQNVTESFSRDLAVKKNNDTIYADCEIEIKTEIKQEASATDSFSHNGRHLFTKDHVKKMKIDTFTYINVMEMDTKTDIASGVHSENERQIFSQDLRNEIKEYSSDSEIEIKEEPLCLETTSHFASNCEQIKDGRITAVLPRLNSDPLSQASSLTHVALVGKHKSLIPRQDNSELKETRKSDGDIRETFFIKESLCLEHPGEHNGDKILSIPMNKKSITCKSNLVDRFGNVYKSETCQKSLCLKPHTCGLCEKTFTKLSSLKRHNLVHKGVKPHKCEICKKTFSQLSHLKQHNLIHEGVKPHKCEICEKTFTNLSDLKRHNLMHKGVRPHKCEICEKTFTQLSSLKTHNLTHEGIQPHKCEICEKAFTHLSSLKQHGLIHEGVKPHKCEICEKTFTHLSGLKQHNLTHEGVKPHKCEMCKKTFTHLSSLKQHNLIHEGVQAYKCEICEQTFTRLSNLKEHNMIHEGVKPHKCEVCEKTFTRLSNLKQHNLIHMGVKSHKCEICGKSFRHLSDLKRHLLVHGKEKCIQKSDV